MIVGAIVLGLVFALFLARLAVTRRHSSAPALRWRQSGARSTGHNSPANDVGVWSLLHHSTLGGDASSGAGHGGPPASQHGDAQSASGHDCSADSGSGSCDGGGGGGD